MFEDRESMACPAECRGKGCGRQVGSDGGRAGGRVGGGVEFTMQAMTAMEGRGDPRGQVCVLGRACREQVGGGLEHSEPGGRGSEAGTRLGKCSRVPATRA